MSVNKQILILVLGMMLVTYIPRLFPFLLVVKNKLPKKVEDFLSYIPYTALGALIIPGVFTATSQMPEASLVGIGFAVVYGWYRGGIIVPVFGSVLVTYLMLLLTKGLV